MLSTAPWWWKERPSHHCRGAATMLILGFILNMLGIGLFCWLIFTLTIFALPFFIALSVVRDAIHGGAGISAAVVVAILAGMLTLVIGQIAIAFTRSAHLRAVIAAEFAVPAAVAGYHVVHVYRKLGCPHCYGGTPLPGAAR